MSSATLTAEPPDEPPATRCASTAFFVGPKAEFSVEPPCANASKFALPIQIAPSASSRSTAVACTGASNVRSMLLAAVVGPPNAKKLSLTTNGTPLSRPSMLPSSTSVARSSARSSVRLISAAESLCALARSMARLTFSTADVFKKSCIFMLQYLRHLYLPVVRRRR